MSQRTIVYVDGFNLFHGALRHTPYKWLDVRALAASLIGSDKNIVAVKYFTARVSPRPNDPDQPMRQLIYLRALASIHAQIVYGRYLSHVVSMFKANQVKGEPPFVDVIKPKRRVPMSTLPATCSPTPPTTFSTWPCSYPETLTSRRP